MNLKKQEAKTVIPCEFKETYLDLNNGLSYEQWENIGQLINRISKSIMWWLGDWLNYGEANYGEKYTQAVDATGRSYQTLANAGYVAKYVETSRRRESLSWSHHAEVASLKPDEQSDWLDRAEIEGMTSKELRENIKGNGRPENEKSMMLTCPYCKKSWEEVLLK